MLSIKRQVPDGSDEVQQPPKKIKAIQEAEVELEKVVNEAVFKASKPLEDQLSRVMVKVTTLEQTSSRLESAWNGEAGIRLIQTCSLNGAPRITKEHLERNGIAKTLRRELCKKLNHSCRSWNDERTSCRGDGRYTTSLATDLKPFLKDVDLLALLPNGPRHAVYFLSKLGGKQIQWDDPLLVEAKCIPGSQYYEEVKTFFTALDDKMGEIYCKSGFDPAIFAENSHGIASLIDLFREDQELEADARRDERMIELARTFGYQVDHFNEFRDDEGYCAQDFEDMTADETEDFEEKLERLDEAAAGSEQLWQHYFPMTLKTLNRIFREMESKENQEQECEGIEAEKDSGYAAGTQVEYGEETSYESNDSDDWYDA